MSAEAEAGNHRVDVRDITLNTRIESIASLAGLPPAWKTAQNEDIFASSAALDPLPESLRGLALSAADVATIEAKQVENARK